MNNFAYYILNKASKNKLAIVDDYRSVTYEELIEYVNGYAVYLKEQNLSHGSRIILSMPDGVEWCVAFLACIYIGAVPILISSKISKSLISKAVDDVSADYLITEVTLSKNNSQLPCHSYDIDAEGFWLTSSGSTGNQKYVVHKHQTLLEQFNLTKDLWLINNTSVLLSSAKLSFGYAFAVYIILGLGHSATIVLTSNVLSHKLLSQRIQTLGITHFFSTPTFLSSLTDEHNTYSSAIKSLKFIMSSTEPLPEFIRTKFKEIYNQPILNGYGSAEAWAWSFTQRPNESEPNDHRVIGRIIPNVVYEIRDNNGNKCETGTMGELYLKHPCVAVKYFNITNNSSFQHLWFKTNDLVFENSQGEVVYVCRKDNLIKIKGMYVIIDELEGIISSHPRVIECLVATYQNDQGLLELTVNIVTNSNITAGDIRRYLKDKVESHQIPKKIVFVESLKRTVTNKKVR
jgi:acyl-coenzyme A synthetase/AMP-(fatty) acid ligase